MKSNTLNILLYWIGTSEYIDSEGKMVSAPKTLWDLMSLLIVPISLAIIAYLFSKTEKENEHERSEAVKKAEQAREENQNQELLLREYISTISTLITEKNLLTVEPRSPVCIVARTMTKVVAHQLIGKRRAVILRFLQEAQLISINKSIISLSGVDFREAELDNANLSDLNLARTNFAASKLNRVNLANSILAYSNMTEASICNSTLRQTNLSRANLSKAVLTESQFDKTDFIRTNLAESTLARSVFINVKFNGADLRGANLCGANFKQSKLNGSRLTNAYADSDTEWPEGFDHLSAGVVIIGEGKL